MKRVLILAVLVLLAAAPAAHASAIAGAQFHVGQPTEVRLSFRASAPGTDWRRTGRESAVLAVAVDGQVVGDVVTVRGARPAVYHVPLGRLKAGLHIASI